MSGDPAKASADKSVAVQSVGPGDGAHESFIVTPNDRLLITGAAGFIGSCVVESLLGLGFRNLICFVRHSSDITRLDGVMKRRPVGAQVGLFRGNLLSKTDCEAACKDVKVIFNLAAGTGEKSFPDAFMNSVVITRNLLESCLHAARLRRFVLVSSFTVYTNSQKSRYLDESCPIEDFPELRGDAYCYAKVKQEEIVRKYGKDFGIPYVMVRPGSVYGSAKPEITGRVGVNTFGIFLHLGGLNAIPFTYVSNCADAVALAGLVKGIDGEAFNVVDDDLPSSRIFLHQYKNNVRRFRSLYVPHLVSYGLCYLWEKYSRWSRGQLPPAFNRRRWRVEWRKTRFTNEKAKKLLRWAPRVSTEDAMRLYFNSCAQDSRNA